VHVEQVFQVPSPMTLGSSMEARQQVFVREPRAHLAVKIANSCAKVS
jgi:hypothetical protein